MSALEDQKINKLKEDRATLEDTLQQLQDAMQQDKAAELLIKYMEDTPEPFLNVSENDWVNQNGTNCCVIS